MIRIEFIFSRFKSIPLGASGEGFRKQTKEGKSLFTLRGLVSCDANKTSSFFSAYSDNKQKSFVPKKNLRHVTIRDFKNQKI